LGAPAEVPWSRFNLADGFIVLGIFLLAAELLVAEGASRVRTRPLDRFEE
jgi:lipoprotein signal peptidase